MLVFVNTMKKLSLQNLGLKGRAAEVYLACLEAGEGKAAEIAAQAQVNRTTVYGILEDLAKLGIISKSQRRGATIYCAESPRTLREKFLEKVKQVEEILPALESVYNTPRPQPKFRFYEGLAGIQTVYEDSLRQPAGSEILGYISADAVQVMPRYMTDYVKRRVEKRIRLKAIYTEGDLIRQYLEKNQAELREAVLLPKGKFEFTDEINIYQDKIAVASYGHKKFGLLIESASMAETQKTIFRLSWEAALKYDLLTKNEFTS